MNESVKLIMEKLESLAPQAQEMFGRMVHVWSYKFFIGFTIALIVLIVFTVLTIKLVKECRRRIEQCENEDKYDASPIVSGFVHFIGAFITGIVSLTTACICLANISLLASILIDPQAAYIMHLMK